MNVLVSILKSVYVCVCVEVGIWMVGSCWGIISVVKGKWGRGPERHNKAPLSDSADGKHTVNTQPGGRRRSECVCVCVCVRVGEMSIFYIDATVTDWILARWGETGRRACWDVHGNVRPNRQAAVLLELRASSCQRVSATLAKRGRELLNAQRTAEMHTAPTQIHTWGRVCNRKRLCGVESTKSTRSVSTTPRGLPAPLFDGNTHANKHSKWTVLSAFVIQLLSDSNTHTHNTHSSPTGNDYSRTHYFSIPSSRVSIV